MVHIYNQLLLQQQQQLRELTFENHPGISDNKIEFSNSRSTPLSENFTLHNSN